MMQLDIRLELVQRFLQEHKCNGRQYLFMGHSQTLLIEKRPCEMTSIAGEVSCTADDNASNSISALRNLVSLVLEHLNRYWKEIDSEKKYLPI